MGEDESTQGLNVGRGMSSGSKLLPGSEKVAGIDRRLLRAMVDQHKLTGLLRCWDKDRLLS